MFSGGASRSEQILARGRNVADVEGNIFQALQEFGPAPGAKKMMNAELEAAQEAQRTGMYGVWRGPGKDLCARIGPSTRCFCAHPYRDHRWKSKKMMAPSCSCTGCVCPGFKYVPSRPEEAGEYWLPRRRGFNVHQWRAKCRCGHAHAEHNPKTTSCENCRCFSYDSSWKCTGCDEKWQEHETVFETEDERRAARLPVGRDFEPLADNPEFAEIVFGQESANALPWQPRPERSVVLSGHSTAARRHRAMSTNATAPGPSSHNANSNCSSFGATVRPNHIDGASLWDNFLAVADGESRPTGGAERRLQDSDPLAARRGGARPGVAGAQHARRSPMVDVQDGAVDRQTAVGSRSRSEGRLGRLPQRGSEKRSNGGI